MIATRARLAALTLAGVGLLPVAACAQRAESGSLRWERPPNVIRPPTLPQDRILTGHLRNEGLRPIDLRARDLRLVDAAGRTVGDARPLFIGAFVRGLYPPTRRPDPLPDLEQRRTGQITRIDPGRSAPLTVAWRERSTDHSPERLEYPSGSLPVP